MKKIAIGLLVIIVALIGVRVWKNATTTEEDRIVRVVKEGERAIEHKDIAGFAGYISPDYSDEFELDKRTVILVLQRIFKEHDKIFIHVQDLKVNIAESNGTAEVKFLATVLVSHGGSAQTKPLAEKGKDRFLLTFKKEDNKWKVVSMQQVEYKFK